MRLWDWSELPILIKFLRRVRPEAVFLYYIGLVYNDRRMITFAPTISMMILGNLPFVTQISNAMGAKPAKTFKSRVGGYFATLLSGGADKEFGTLLKHSDRVIVFSEHHLRKLEKHQPDLSERTVLIPPPPILHMSPNDSAVRNRARQKLGVGPDERLIANFGYGYEGKGLETLIGSFALVAKRRQDCKLALIGRLVENPISGGGTYADQIRKLIAQSGCEDRILVTGGYEADSDEGSAFLRASDICVLPLDGGIQLNNSSLSAALAHGLPILTTRHPQLEQPFLEGQNVLLSPPKDCPALAANIERTLDDEGLRRTLSAGASVLSQTWFSWERAVEQTLSAFATA
jgi:glycosyltransferase involved in cell wall biosynthesis